MFYIKLLYIFAFVIHLANSKDNKLKPHYHVQINQKLFIMNDNEFRELLEKIRGGGKPAIFNAPTQSQLDDIKEVLNAKKQSIDEYYDYLKSSRLKFRHRPLSKLKRLLNCYEGYLRYER